MRFHSWGGSNIHIKIDRERNPFKIQETCFGVRLTLIPVRYPSN